MSVLNGNIILFYAFDIGDEIHLNEIAEVQIKSLTPLPVDSYSRNRTTGSFILIDETSHNTVAAGMIV